MIKILYSFKSLLAHKLFCENLSLVRGGLIIWQVSFARNNHAVMKIYDLSWRGRDINTVITLVRN